jgi:hypothetical protein
MYGTSTCLYRVDFAPLCYLNGVFEFYTWNWQKCSAVLLLLHIVNLYKIRSIQRGGEVGVGGGGCDRGEPGP